MWESRRLFQALWESTCCVDFHRAAFPQARRPKKIPGARRPRSPIAPVEVSSRSAARVQAGRVITDPPKGSLDPGEHRDRLGLRWPTACPGLLERLPFHDEPGSRDDEIRIGLVRGRRGDRSPLGPPSIRAGLRCRTPLPVFARLTRGEPAWEDYPIYKIGPHRIAPQVRNGHVFTNRKAIGTGLPASGAPPSRPSSLVLNRLHLRPFRDNPVFQIPPQRHH